MLTLDGLRAWGANVDEGMGRCMGREDFYLKLVRMARNDTNMAKLRNAADAGDLDAAFEAAHALKGIMANLGLTPVLKPVTEITEMLRARSQADYGPLMDAVEAGWNGLVALVDGR